MSVVVRKCPGQWRGLGRRREWLWKTNKVCGTLMWHDNGCARLFWEMPSNAEKGLKEIFNKQVSYLLGNDTVLMALRPYKVIITYIFSYTTYSFMTTLLVHHSK